MVVSEGKARLFSIYLAGFIALLMLSNIIAVKLIQVGPVVLTAAVFLFPFTYIFDDVLTEVYGFAGSRKIIWLGFGANALMVAVFLAAIALPFPPFWKGQEAFRSVLGTVPRIVAGSMVGYWCGEFTNSYILARMKEWMVRWDPKHRHLWMRTVGSTIGGEAVDSVLFVTVGFGFTMPWAAVATLIAWQWVFKVGVEVVMTPVTYLVVGATKRAEGLDVVGAKSYSPFQYGEGE